MQTNGSDSSLESGSRGNSSQHTPTPYTPQSYFSSPRWLRFPFAGLNIWQKVSLGYALSIGVAVAGIIAGQMVGENFYAREMQQQYERARQEEYLLSQLKIGLLDVQIHAQQLIPYMSNSQQYRDEHAKLLVGIEKAKLLSQDLSTFVDNHLNSGTIDIQELRAFLQNYDLTLEVYIKNLDTLLGRIDPVYLKPAMVPDAQQALLRFTSNSENAIDLARVSNHLSSLLTKTHQSVDTAQSTLKQTAELRSKIITTSLVVSILMAIALALYISRLIARPIEATTKVAQQAIRNTDFSQRATIYTKDEIGVLAASLNQLMDWVTVYTQELEQARQTLEHRVEERTEEISRQHAQLQQAHEQLNQAIQDLQQTQSQLIQTEKMSSLGQMVAGIAHEINNPINFIFGNLTHASNYVADLLQLLNLYQQHYPVPHIEIQQIAEDIDLAYLIEDLPQIIHSMRTGTERIRQIVLSLRNFSRLDESDIKAVDVHEGIDSTLLILNHRLKRGIQLIKQYGELPLIECSPAQLNQVFMNIISNAIDALTTSTQEIKQITITTYMSSPTGAIVSIKDNGSGIPAEIASKLFDPFFTTKPIGQGTGLGLSICYQIIEKHGGKIEAVSRPGAGAEFVISLPIHATQP